MEHKEWKPKMQGRRRQRRTTDVMSWTRESPDRTESWETE
jgi:hypothetical protein